MTPSRSKSVTRDSIEAWSRVLECRVAWRPVSIPADKHYELKFRAKAHRASTSISWQRRFGNQESIALGTTLKITEQWTDCTVVLDDVTGWLDCKIVMVSSGVTVLVYVKTTVQSVHCSGIFSVVPEQSILITRILLCHEIDVLARCAFRSKLEL